MPPRTARARSASKTGKASTRGRAPARTKAKKVLTKTKKSRAARGTVAHQSAYKRRNWAKRLVFMGKKVKTSTGLLKRDLVKNKWGKVVSKKKAANGRKRYHENHLDLWMESLQETRQDHNVDGFLLCKRAGTKAERELFQSTSLRWKEAVRNRMVQMVKKLDMHGHEKILSQLAKGDATSPGPSGNVKEEHQIFKQGDRVKLKKNVASSPAMRGKVGIVERYQLGRWCINFSGDLQAVKPEQLERAP